MESNVASMIYLKDYQPPAYWVDNIDLIFDLQEGKTSVRSILHCRKNTFYTEAMPLVLLGKKLTLKSLSLDGKSLSEKDFKLDSETLTIPIVPESFTIQIETEIVPEKNTELSGLYRAKTIYCTQCEAEGFRRITYYPDRPDVMAKFTTTIYANKQQYPVLLSNGNCVASGNEGVDRHWVKWEDPFKKPCYLFALVAGDLVAVEDHFVTLSKRLVTLKIFVERENQDKCQHAMEALKKSMRWDEETYGREYDLDIYMIVVVNDFNMGAMENKGLNIFNSKYILARPETATDFDYQHIDAVVGHEYFHNWSGNRVTCRDWFQLSLKEGLTVFREHQFSTDITKSPVSLIEQVRNLRGHQFAEDAGPMAHSVRPEAYMEINNFYTSTIYEKGAELIRMLQTLLGRETFRRGMDLYFERHDGQAVTTEDFVAAMESVSGQDFTQFRLWYSQAGTPEIDVLENYDESTKTYRLTLKQFCPPTPLQPEKLPFVIPIAVGLLGPDGQALLPKTEVLILKSKEETYTFSNIKVLPVLSILREFSAPIKIRSFMNEEQLAFLLAHDSDAFNRWEAGQKLVELLIWQCVEDHQANRKMQASKQWLNALQAILRDKKLAPALKAEMLTLPSLSYLVGLKTPANIDGLFAARTFLKEELAKYLETDLRESYHECLTPGPYEYTPEAVSKRQLKSLCLSYLLLLNDKEYLKLCLKQWQTANNMTDSLAVLGALSNWQGPEREQVLNEFYEKWQQDPLVLDKWFRIHAASELPQTLSIVKKLTEHPAFSITNPNKVYSLIGAFSAGNLVRFHDKNGEGYAFLTDMIIKLDLLNPQVAARMMSALTRWKQFDVERQALMRKQLERLQVVSNLSKDVFEVVTKCLA